MQAEIGHKLLKAKGEKMDYS